ncbi:aerobic-type carbon monoxide dehydrogenase, middle subunit CoxM/CutM-like protein [Acidovorax sp. CF316]|uniref:FAD binding domain-containing protein n=1 Tax=Acidovorax sp. CF316 TaxID=1144317 RepID=UPI00026BE289|nr:xanthine dehydrogenase family protein subunit M [Acidovorax sp. CF316]EJE50471.1 aerobic-type carbon monoxide dehydrogenase, middle subunit CoxM/CutM-like protein [Acidovorax sp. CF316]
MKGFTYLAATDTAQALASGNEGAFIAGGTNLLDLMKEGVARPRTLVDINPLPLSAIEQTQSGGVLLGALARNAATAYHPLVRDRYPLLSAAILSGASPQIRNMATDGGNLLQRTRCHYFYDTGTPCNKRLPGGGCSAIGNLARQHAILGASPQCIATHPSDMCVALAALDAVVHLESPAERRSVPFAEFHRLPGDHPDIDNTMHPGELITHIELPPSSQFAQHSAYLKIRERASYAFALVSVAAALHLDESGRIVEARIAVGGVAHKPWRQTQAEALLQGKRPERTVFAEAGAALLAGAVPQGSGPGSNAFKIPMAQRAVVRALEMALAGQTSLLPGNAVKGHTA